MPVPAMCLQHLTYRNKQGAPHTSEEETRPEPPQLQYHSVQKVEAPLEDTESSHLESLYHCCPQKNDFVGIQKVQHDRNRHGQRRAAEETRHWWYLANFVPEAGV
jgi:hypothetical protein